MPYTSIIRRFVGCLVAAALLPVAAPAQEEVMVTNLPEVQQVTGTVSVEAPLPQTKIVRLGGAIVAPVGPDDTTALVSGGTLESSGFRSVVLSIAGQVRADRFSEGRVGALLIPEEEIVLRAFAESGEVLFPLRVEAAANAQTAYFGSAEAPYTLGFPRYRVYFYNTTDRPASVKLFAYLN